MSAIFIKNITKSNAIKIKIVSYLKLSLGTRTIRWSLAPPGPPLAMYYGSMMLILGPISYDDNILAMTLEYILLCMCITDDIFGHWQSYNYMSIYNLHRSRVDNKDSLVILYIHIHNIAIALLFFPCLVIF